MIAIRGVWRVFGLHAILKRSMIILNWQNMAIGCFYESQNRGMFSKHGSFAFFFGYVEIWVHVFC
jgi:hypothetical protein